MENLSPSLPKKSFREHGFGGKTVYDDVFGGPAKFGVPILSPRVEDYSEIFEGFHAVRGLSFPILDLPPVVDEAADLFFDVRSSKFDYSEVFSGFNDLDFAVSYEELFKQTNGGDDSSFEAWTSAQSESLSDESDPSACSDENQSLSSGDLPPLFDGTKQFNILYHNANPKGKEDMLNRMTHVTQSDDVPEYSSTLDETPPAQKMEDEKLHLHLNLNTDFGGKVRLRALAEARERLEKASAEARERLTAKKASTEARLKVERAAVDRATAEAPERAFEKAKAEKASFEAREQVVRSVADKFSAYSSNKGLRQTSSSSDLQYHSVGSYHDLKYSHSSVHGGLEGESAQRCKARLERHQRTAECAAKTLAEKNMCDLLAHKEQVERNRFAEALDAEVKRWSSGKAGNLRALLSTLQYILGPDSGWQPIPLTDVITDVAVKKAYRKATLCVHPDKLQQRGSSIQQKYICEKVFDLLKEAWNKFNSEER